MAVKTQEEIKTVGQNKIVTGYAYDESNPSDKKLVYEINKDKRIIEYYPFNSKYYFFEQIILAGFSVLPEIFKKNGYCKNRIFDYPNRTFKGKRIKTITINRSGASGIIKREKTKHLHITYKDLSKLSDELGSMDYYHRRNKSLTVNKHFNGMFPKLIKQVLGEDPQGNIKLALQTLSRQAIQSFEKEDIEKITDVLSSLMKSNHRSQIAKSDLFKNTKLKIDTVTLDQVIEDFEKKLGTKTSESAWGHFLERNLFLIDSKYIYPSSTSL